MKTPTLESFFEVGGIRFKVTSIEDKTVEVVHNDYENSVVIPSLVDYNGTTYSVTTIREGAFERCSGLKSIEIPNSVTEIGKMAFFNCSGLTSIKIPNNVTSIGKYAFDLCFRLKSINVELGNSKYDSRENCNAIIETETNTLIAGCQNTVIPVGVTSIGERAFYECRGLESLVIPNSVSSIGERAFAECRRLTSVVIPDSVTVIGDRAFTWCEGLTSIVILNGVTSIGEGAFRGCSGLTSIVIPNSVTEIGESAFYECTGLESIVIPNSVTEIGEWAFYGCSGLKSIEIPDSVTEIEKGAFKWCRELTSIKIPDSVTSIGKEAFSDCSGIKSIVIPNSVTEIGDGAFAGCSGLTNIKVEIGNSKYDSRDDCNAIIETKSNTLIAGCQNTVIPRSVTSIEEGAFSLCSKRTSIISLIPTEKLFPIEWTVFLFEEIDKSYCTLYVPKGAKDVYAKTNGWSNFMDIKELPENIKEKKSSLGFHFNLYDIRFKVTSYENKTVEVVIYNGNANNVVIPSTINYNNSMYFVTSIGGSAFHECSGVTSIVIPDSVTEIGESAFQGCSGLTSIVIPDSVTSIGDEAFKDCSGLTSIVIPNSVTSIGYGVFCGCGSLSSVNIPNSVTSIRAGVFHNCYTLKSIIVENGNSIYDSRDNCNAIIETKSNTLIAGCQNTKIPDSVTSIGYGAFRGCIGLKCIVIPDSVTEIEDEAFYECSGLESIVIPDSVTTIGRMGFCCCYSLTSIEIPNSVTSIGYSMFAYCHNLISVSIGNSVTSIGIGAFAYCHNLISVSIGNSVTSIGESAFSGCGKLESIVIPDSVTEIGKGAFDGCSGIESIKVENGNRRYDSRENCNAIIETETNTLIIGCQNTKIPDNITEIGNYALFECISLTSIEIPDTVISIGHNAFSGCRALSCVISHISAHKLNILNNAFDWISIHDCTLYVPKWTKDAYANMNSLRDFKNIIELPECFKGDTPVMELNFEVAGICYSVTSVDNKTVEVVHNDYEGSIAIPSTVAYNNITFIVTSIGEGAFCGCKSLTNIVLPVSISSIANNAFSGCSELTSIISRIPVKAIFPTNEIVFDKIKKKDCTLYVPKGAKEAYANSVGWNNFEKIEESSEYINEETSTLDLEFKVDAIHYKVTSVVDKTVEVISNNYIGSVAIPSTVNYNDTTYIVTSINGMAFGFWEELTIDECLRIEEFEEFEGFEGKKFCSSKSLTRVKIPVSVTSIGRGALNGCIALRSIIVESGNHKYDSRDNCNAIIETESNTLIVGCKNTLIPDSVSAIGKGAFAGCSELTSIVIPDSVTEIGNSAFSDCRGLNSVVIPDSVTAIGEWAFYSCRGLKSIVIPDGVTSIGEGAFSGCWGLNSIMIPDSVTEIGESAFYECTRLTNIISHIPADKLFPIKWTVFLCEDIYKSNCTLYVPKGAKDVYAKTDGWRDFENIVELKE